MARILIVDDDAAFRCIARDFLEMNGYECAEADSVAQARRQLWWNTFDLVLSDLNMPMESGLDLLNHVISSYPATPFVMVTADGDDGARAHALKLGASAYLFKPCRLNELLSVVKKTIGKPVEHEGFTLLWAWEPSGAGMTVLRHTADGLAGLD